MGTAGFMAGARSAFPGCSTPPPTRGSSFRPHLQLKGHRFRGPNTPTKKHCKRVCRPGRPQAAIPRTPAPRSTRPGAPGTHDVTPRSSASAPSTSCVRPIRSRGCHNKSPQTRSFKQQKPTIPQAWRLEVQAGRATLPRRLSGRPLLPLPTPGGRVIPLPPPTHVSHKDTCRGI